MLGKAVTLGLGGNLSRLVLGPYLNLNMGLIMISDCFLNLDLDWLLFLFFSSFSVPTSSSSSSWPRCCSSSTSGSRCRKRRTRPSRRSRHSSGKTTERPVDKIETNGIEKKNSYGEKNTYLKPGASQKKFLSSAFCRNLRCLKSPHPSC